MLEPLGTEYDPYRENGVRVEGDVDISANEPLCDI